MNRQIQLLVSIQNLELMLKDVEDEAKAKELAEMGFPMEVDKIKQDLESQLAQIEPKHRNYYLRLKKRFPNPVVSVWEGHCTGCFANVPTSFSSVTNEERVMQCESCGRILFKP
jgi:predicted  nucleic acid-binding Zn-ribbon protein